MVVVKKRINARFFARVGNNVTNPMPGTVVDNEVTKPEWYVFNPTKLCPVGAGYPGIVFSVLCKL